MILKFMPEKIIKIFGSRFFLLTSCVIFFLLSIFFRSIIDIGADTGIYLHLGKKIAQGKKYYYDFFESNFPISFYLYALEYQISQLVRINPIILSEIVINLLALSSIFWSAKILQSSTIFEKKAHYNLIIVGFFLGFFLRPNALQVGEFGTKTSLLLLLLYPYISYSFERKIALTRKDLTYRGLLMGLIPCIKPHYLIFIIFIELHKFYQKKSFRFLIEFDKLVMYLIGALYLFLMIKFTPEFFEFIVPMWPKIYSAYDNIDIFFENSWRHIAARIAPFLFIFLIFSRLRFGANDKILALFFVAASLLMIMENVGTIDQIVIFDAIITICVLKILFDLFDSKLILFSENKFIILGLIFVPIFDIEIMPASVFGLGGFVNIWLLLALIYPFFLAKKLTLQQRKKYFSVKNISVFLATYLALVSSLILLLRHFDGWVYLAISMPVLFGVLFFFEKKIYSKFYSQLSPFSVFVVIAAVSCLLYSYIFGVIRVFTHDDEFTSPNKISDFVTYYSQVYAPKKDEGFTMVSIWIAHQFPTLDYLEKEIDGKFYIAALQANQASVGSRKMFAIDDSDRVFVNSYLFDDVKNQLKNPHIKGMFFNESPNILNKKNRCLISTLEYYFSDPEFKKIFLENFHFENHVIISKKVVPLKKIKFITSEKENIFDQVKPTTNKILHDFEVYVRNEK